MANHWHTILNLIEQGTLRINTLSKETGIKANKISVWKAQGTTPKYEDYLLLKAWLQKKHPELIVAEGVAVTKEDLGTLIIELSAKINVMQSALTELLQQATGKSFVEIQQSMQAAEQDELNQLKQRFS